MPVTRREPLRVDNLSRVASRLAVVCRPRPLPNPATLPLVYLQSIRLLGMNEAVINAAD